MVVAALVGGALWYHFSNPDPSRYEPVVKALTANEWPSDSGRISLTARFPGLTPRDEMYITRRADQSFLALFPTYYGRGTSLLALMYTSRPIDDADTWANASDPLHRYITVARWKLCIDRRIDDHWYLVSHRLH